MNITLPVKRPPSPSLTEVEVRRIVREIVRTELDMRIETLKNLVEPAPEPVIPGLVRFAVDAFEVGSLVADAAAAFAIGFVKAAIR